MSATPSPDKLATRKAYMKLARQKYEEKRKAWRRMAAKSGDSAPRSQSDAVRRGFLEAPVTVASSYVAPHYNRNPSGSSAPANGICSTCHRSRDEVAWRKDGKGKKCMECTVAARREARRTARLQKTQSRS